MKKIFFCLVCLWSFSGWAITAKLSRSEISAGESVELIFSSDSPIGNIDYSPLTQDFMLGGQSSSQSSRYVNGVGSTTYQKSIILFPLKEGVLKLPSLTVESEKTVPLTLTIQKENTLPNQENPATKQILPKIKASVSNEKPYVGQSFFYILTLSDKEDLVEAELIPNFPEGLKLSNIGQDTEKVEQQKVVLERPYLIKAEKAGNVEILPAILNGNVLYQVNQGFQGKGIFSLLNARDLMNAFSSGTRPVQIISNPVHLEIQNKPEDWEGWWLPTTKAELNTSLQLPDNLKAGDVFKITISLTALNVDSNDLPVPKLPTAPHFRYYPQPEERHVSQQKNGKFQGSVQITYDIMPLKEGEMTLSEIKIPWFNTKTGKKEIASTKPLFLNIQPGNIDSVLKPDTSKNVKTEGKKEVLKEKKVLLSPYLIWGGLTLLLGGIFCCWIIHKKKIKTDKKEKPIPDFYPF